MKFIMVFLVSFTFLFSNVCDDIKDNVSSFFGEENNYKKVDKNLKCTQIMNTLKNLKDVSLQIRGVNIDCDGSYAIVYQKKFQFKILKALLAPEIYKKDLPDAETADEITNKNRDYFKIWSIKSLYNYNKFAEFNSLYQVAVPMLVDYYEYAFGYDEGSAIYFANRLANEYLNVAVGSHKGNILISDLDKNIINNTFDINLLLGYLYENHPSNLELDSALKTAILMKRDKEFVDVLLKWGANINSGYESALFFALNDLNMVTYLINKGANINYKNSFGKTPLFDAVELNNIELVNFLIDNGANVNSKIISNNEKMGIVSTIGDYTPFGLCGLAHTSKSLLMHAAKYSNLEIVKKLIELGARIDDVDDLGFNAADFAIMNDDKSILTYLHNIGLKENILFGEHL
ncbi:ankyrin domain-containing protein [Campylobacter blaseri]|uniref:Uncharacterized protein n=1 Tax=Campylobacter blaseri TaxID=2042961 RepID=A0A2P8R2B4_9BACT|nr:ankyrin repeat domain-containing protein [Campylobacter blaseri]PSM52637.1 hypothetical protein CQ405_02590 [Campylobacter blaseri]PSM54285.1 hypothetical protein CRN67_02590 [Campylobacter blaseri]QKF85936.1 ankyrin domain-containing protein [Campylobacter blaseri]